MEGRSDSQLTTMRLIYPTTLFRGEEIGLNAKFSLTLTNNKRPHGDDPSGHKFCG
jgi:hypothetical protein